jgi:hypothetical protein
MRDAFFSLIGGSMAAWMTLLSATAVQAEFGGTAFPVTKRFSTAETSDVPDFQRHVSPLLGRLGCNGRSCHGSFQGQGDFRLSLFGYDFAMDHRALLGDSSGAEQPRIDHALPDSSLILTKPLTRVDHEGGQRFAEGAWPHHLLRRWIESGAHGTASLQALKKLIVHPAEILFDQSPSPIRLQVIAEWENGDREDVTPLCRFRSNDESVVTVDEDGVLTSAGEGDSDVIVFYDNGIIAVPVLRPFRRVSNPSVSVAGSFTTIVPKEPRTEVDRFVLQKLRKLNITPSLLCSDAEFLRRVSLDLTGTLPTPAEVEQFLSDPSELKRRKKVDELLERPSYAAWWANRLCDFTGCNPAQQAELGQETSAQWYMWMYARLRENIPYDDLVSRIVLATGRQTGQSYDDYASEMSAYHRDSAPADFAERASMPHYWTRRTMRQPDQAAEAFAHNFLGVRLQCAQCHKHPFAPWTQADYQTFSQFFVPIKYGVAPESLASYRDLAGRVGVNVGGEAGADVTKEVFRLAQRGRTIPWRELYIESRSSGRSLDLLRSGPVTIRGDQDPREPLMSWMADRNNPWFARALVNRVWAGYFHHGIIDPPDDLNPANPPSNPALLDWLVSEFIQHDFDMKWLHRTIATSDTYQRSWIPNETNREDRRNYSRAIPRRMPAEVVYDSIKQSLAAIEQSDEVRTDLSRRAIGHLSMRLAGTYAMQVFGKPDRAVNCDCERVNQPNLLQTIFLQNDPLIDDRLAESGWLQSVQQQEAAGWLHSPDALIREAWLRAYSREPTATESSRAAQHLEAAESITEGLRDLMWAIVNTKEYVLIR